MKDNDENRGGFFSMFSGLDKLFDVVADMVENNKDETHLKGNIKPNNQKDIVGKYGFHIKLGQDNLDQFASKLFENSTAKKETAPKTVIPSTDIFEEADCVTIVTELPGVEKEDILLEIDYSTVTFTASGKDVNYQKKVELDFAPDKASIRESFSNSIYSIIINKL